MGVENSLRFVFLSTALTLLIIGCDSASNLQKKPVTQVNQNQSQESEKPEIEFDEFAFANAELAAQAKYLFDIACATAEDGWIFEPFKQVNSDSRTHRAIWKTSKSTYYERSNLPVGIIKLEFSRPRTASETVDEVEAYGTWVPSEGWAASVQVDSKKMLHVTFGRVRPTEPRFSFSGKSKVTFPQHARATLDTRGYSYRYQSWRNRNISDEAAAKKRKEAFAIFDSAETFRDALLADIEQLRQTVTADIDQSKNVKVFDTSNVRSDSPPVEVFEDHQLSAATAKALLEKLIEQLDEQEKLVQENWKAMHAALIKAMPIDAEKF